MTHTIIEYYKTNQTQVKLSKKRNSKLWVDSILTIVIRSLFQNNSNRPLAFTYVNKSKYIPN